MFGLCFLTITLPQTYAQEDQSGNKLRVFFADSTAEPYVVAADTNNKYTVSQSYSWVRDYTSRHNLISYSIDDGPYKEISRKPRGSLSIEIAADTAKTLTFRSTVQYPVTAVTDSNEYLQVLFSPTSPTGDNWFDAGTEIIITVSNVEHSTSPTIRQQIVSWSLDNSKHAVAADDKSTFTTDAIKMDAPHLVRFLSKTQYYVDVVTSQGVAIGEGWYDAGSVASVTASNPYEVLIPQIFAGWEDSSGSQYEDNTVSFVVDSPKTLTAKWATDYSLLASTVIVPIAGAGAIIFILKKRSHETSRSSAKVPIPPVHEVEQGIRASGSILAVQQLREVTQEELAINTTEIANYSRELSLYALQKSIETLDMLHSSGLISDSKLSKVREKVERMLE